eukprot:TRINITY_DN63982_c0_g1_i1.p1 TRINITY_DN63982_c0_g1~~TRINITY_DN63982_c0_g1_i1.p1  ORF type:complete len:781 (+),score=68.67 TRINITY_DN63982_c0_g1_i1:59-2344(+)
MFLWKRYVSIEPPDDWLRCCKYNVGVLLTLGALFAVFLALLRRAPSSFPSSHIGITCGILGALVPLSVECIAQRRWARTQTRACCSVLILGTALNVYIATFLAEEVHLVAFFGLSLLTKLSAPVFGWDAKLFSGFASYSCLTLCLTFYFSVSEDTALCSPLTRWELIFTECVYTFFAGVLWLTHSCSLQTSFESAGLMEFDNKVLRQVMRLTWDGELCVSIPDAGEAWVEGASSLLKDLIGRQVAGECLRKILDSDAEYQRVVESLEISPGVTVLNTTLKNDDGEALPVELVAAKLYGYAAGYGEGRSSKESGYLVWVRQVEEAAPLPTASASPAAARTPDVRPSPAESLGSVLPHVVGRVQQDEGSCEHHSNPSPVVSASERNVQSSSTDYWMNGHLDMTKIMSIGTKEHWLIDPADLEIQPYSLLGKGGFGIVIEAVYFGVALAVKIAHKRCDRSLAETDNQQTHFHELRMLRHARHPNIVQFYGACIEPSSREIALVFEKIDAPTLGAFVTELSARATGTKPLKSHQFRVKVMLDLSRALDYLHARSPPLIHGDLKPANIFVYWKGPHAMLSDFGLAKKLSHEGRATGFTTRWAAPEIVKGTSSPTTEADVFAFGRLMSFLLTDEYPLREWDEPALRQMIISGQQLPMPVWPETLLARICSGLVELCLSVTPKNRPQMHAISKLLEKAPDLLSSQQASAGPNPLGLLALVPAQALSLQADRLDMGSGTSRGSNSSGVFLRSLDLARECVLANRANDLT